MDAISLTFEVIVHFQKGGNCSATDGPADTERGARVRRYIAVEAFRCGWCGVYTVMEEAPEVLCPALRSCSPVRLRRSRRRQCLERITLRSGGGVCFVREKSVISFCTAGLAKMTKSIYPDYLLLLKLKP